MPHDQVGPSGVSYTWRGGAILPIHASPKPVQDKELHGCPQVVLVLRRDKHSSGCSVVITSPSGGDWPHIKVALAERWKDTLPGEEGCIEIAIQALQSVLGRLRGIQEDSEIF